MHIIGIDYGAKLAGTTVICHYQMATQVFRFYQSEKKKDADHFAKQILLQVKPSVILIDAPLSLPGIYRYESEPEFNDHFYRKADRALNAMSPMFIGGLTARAMKLCQALEKEGMECLETYPAILARRYELKKLGYKKSKQNIAACLQAIQAAFPLVLPKEQITNWHQFDALLACWSAYRYHHKKHDTYGDEREGQIII